MALVGLILLQENDRELEQKSVRVPRWERWAPFLICLHSFTKDIQQSKREVYIKEVLVFGGGFSHLFHPGGATQPRRNLYDEESNKYLYKLGGQIGVQLQLVDGGREQGKGRGISQCLLHSKK